VTRSAFTITLVVVAAAACSRREEPPEPAPKGIATTLSGTVERTTEESPAAAKDEAPAPAAQRSLAGKKVLHVGDSMVGGSWGLTRALEVKLAEEGAKVVRHTKVSESLASFDKSPTLKDLLRTHDPDIVIINLGSNDALVPFPASYARHVRNITRRVGERECWWIGPPSWQGPDTGIVDVIRDNVGSCRFFDSSKLELERASDGIHPTDRAAAKWADAFWEVFREPS
jgi:lysophospholipase L1-like esterase